MQLCTNARPFLNIVAASGQPKLWELTPHEARQKVIELTGMVDCQPRKAAPGHSFGADRRYCTGRATSADSACAACQPQCGLSGKARAKAAMLALPSVTMASACFAVVIMPTVRTTMPVSRRSRSASARCNPGRSASGSQPSHRPKRGRAFTPRLPRPSLIETLSQISSLSAKRFNGAEPWSSHRRC
jgi:hypothetical protein